MAIGERIHHFRLLRGFTQKYLGQQLGFSDSQADVRIAQYEKGARSPKEKYLKLLEFRHFVEFFSFRKIGGNHKEKSLVKKVTVVVALDLGTGNTKNLEYENE